MAGSVRGRISEATRAKMRAAKAGKPLSAAHRAKLSAAKKGKPRAPANLEAYKAWHARRRAAKAVSP